MQKKSFLFTQFFHSKMENTSWGGREGGRCCKNEKDTQYKKCKYIFSLKNTFPTKLNLTIFSLKKMETTFRGGGRGRCCKNVNTFLSQKHLPNKKMSISNTLIIPQQKNRVSRKKSNKNTSIPQIRKTFFHVQKEGFFIVIQKNWVVPFIFLA